MADGYRREYFDPQAAGGALDEATGTISFTLRDGDRLVSTYVYNDDVVLAVNVALAVNRPLLVSGEPGSGKSTLARNVAAVLGWRYYQRVITSRTQARDLLWSFDAVRRLGDAQAGMQDGRRELLPKPFYVEPEALWWAFDPASAAVRGMEPDQLTPEQRAHPAFRAADPGTAGDPARAVVLLDEIDKADPDMPNDMLEPLDVGSFRVHETDARVERGDRRVMLIITTNGERELPPAFLRRCVTLHLPRPRADWLARIGGERFPRADAALVRELAREVMRLRREAHGRRLREPSTAEYLDALAVCAGLGITTESPAWERARQAVLLKHAPVEEPDEEPETP
ncbi:MAG TPA: MoxR family ATPase [Longimicrobiaceae bacterium]|nr:MoxR family ATPase [Longimicrobiaceae bacterium]